MESRYRMGLFQVILSRVARKVVLLLPLMSSHTLRTPPHHHHHHEQCLRKASLLLLLLPIFSSHMLFALIFIHIVIGCKPSLSAYIRSNPLLTFS